MALMRLIPACKIRRFMVVWNYENERQAGILTVTKQHPEDQQRLQDLLRTGHGT